VNPHKELLQLPKDATVRWTEETTDMREEKTGICQVVVCVNLLARRLVEEHQSGELLIVWQYETQQNKTHLKLERAGQKKILCCPDSCNFCSCGRLMYSIIGHDA
jgi:hypothetical protein